MGGTLNNCRCTSTVTPAGFICETCGGIVPPYKVLHSCEHGAIITKAAPLAKPHQPAAPKCPSVGNCPSQPERRVGERRKRDGFVTERNTLPRPQDSGLRTGRDRRSGAQQDIDEQPTVEQRNRRADDELYDAYLLGCEDECLPEPMSKSAFIEKFRGRAK